MSEIQRFKDKPQIPQPQSYIQSQLFSTQMASNQNQSLIQTQIQQNSNISDNNQCLKYFIDKLFVNNQCCNQEDNNYCVICQKQKFINTKEIESIVLHTLKDLIKNSSEFKKFCSQKLQIGASEINLESFLKEFQELDKQNQSLVKLKSQNPSQIRPGQSMNQQIQSDNQKINKKGQYHSAINPQSQKEFLEPLLQTEILQNPNQKIPDYFREIKQVDHSVEYIEEKQDQIQEFSPDTLITIQIKIRNNGKKKWPEKVYLKEVSHYPTIKHFVPALSSRQTSEEKINFISPLNSGQYHYDWVLFYEKDSEEIRIGDRWEKTFKVKELEQQLKIKKCLEMIKKKLINQSVNEETIKEEIIKLIEKSKGQSISAIVNTVVAELDY